MIKIDIVYSHQDFYIVNKPENVSFHSESEAGFFVQLEQQVKQKLYPVHRLDKVTSGLVIAARNQVAAARFGDLFANKSQQQCLEKYYIALVSDKPKKKQGWVKGDMAKSRRGAYKLLKSTDNPAITRFYSCAIGDGKRLFLLKPITGKTHQLRVALKSLSAPIIGDINYSGRHSDRVYLHAFALFFKWQEQQISVVCDPLSGQEFSQLSIESIQPSWQQPWLLKW